MRLKVQKVTPKGRQPWWRLAGGNGEILASSEGYGSKAKRDQTVNQVAAVLADAKLLAEVRRRFGKVDSAEALLVFSTWLRGEISK